jgi:Family of unknown function (DUF6069)
MSSPWLESKTPVGPPSSANPTIRQLLYAAAVTGGWAGVISLLIYLVGRLFGMTFTVGTGPGNEPQQVPFYVVLLLPLVFAVGFALLASLARGWRHAGRIVFWVGTIGALASLVAPLYQPESVGWFARIVLALMHVITWLLVVPQIARIVGDSEPGKFVVRDE